MSQPFIGEIRLFAGNFAPNGWRFCQGQLLPISEYDTLFNLVGTTYGGDGESTFALPDLSGRVPMHAGAGYVLGQSEGQESVALNQNQMPSHRHAPLVSSAVASAAFSASTGLPGNTGGSNIYGPMGTPGPMKTGLVGISTGSGQPHENMAPWMGLNYIISLFGIYPSPN